MSWSTDLSPTALFLSRHDPAVTARMSTGYQQAWEEVYPGWGSWVGYTGYYPTHYPAGQIEAYLGITKTNRFIRPFD